MMHYRLGALTEHLPLGLEPAFQIEIGFRTVTTRSREFVCAPGYLKLQLYKIGFRRNDILDVLCSVHGIFRLIVNSGYKKVRQRGKNEIVPREFSSGRLQEARRFGSKFLG